MNHDEHERRDPEAAYDAWLCDDVAARSYAPPVRMMPPSIVAASAGRRTMPEPTDERRAMFRDPNGSHMARFRAMASMGLFNDARRR